MEPFNVVVDYLQCYYPLFSQKQNVHMCVMSFPVCVSTPHWPVCPYTDANSPCQQPPGGVVGSVERQGPRYRWGVRSFVGPQASPPPPPPDALQRADPGRHAPSPRGPTSVQEPQRAHRSPGFTLCLVRRRDDLRRRGERRRGREQLGGLRLEFQRVRELRGAERLRGPERGPPALPAQQPREAGERRRTQCRPWGGPRDTHVSAVSTLAVV